MENSRLTKAELSSIEKAKQNIKQQIKELGGIPQKFEVNQRMQLAYADMKGNVATRDQIKSSARLLSTCGENEPDYLDLKYYYRLYQCGDGYYIRFGWYISWDNTVVLENPYNTSNKTKGTIKVSIPGNSNAYSNTTYDVKITNLGVDPDNSSNNIYSVEMTSSTVVPIGLVETSGATLRLGGYFASDCESLENYSVIPMSVTGYGFSTTLDSDPCTRNDKVWFSLPGDVGYRQIGVCGYDPFGQCEYEVSAAPSLQEAWYSIDGGATWSKFYNYTSIYSGLLGTEFVSKLNFARSATLSPGTYDIKIRYRNIKYDSPSTPLGTLPTFSNSCGTGGWYTPLWTIESYPGMVVN